LSPSPMAPFRQSTEREQARRDKHEKNTLGRRVAGEGDEYVSKEEFAGVFESEQVGLQRLALLLTANSDAAAQCLSLALEQCLATSFVFKGWALSWMRRVVIRSAISLVRGSGGQSFVNTNDDTDNGLIAFSRDDSLGAIATSESILDLPEFERFVFVICVLERYSIHDCALLLGKSPRDVNEVRDRVGNQVGQIDDFGNRPLQVAVR
jgi:DNA-directed RNA polymerase specialized sigma24 family protein